MIPRLPPSAHGRTGNAVTSAAAIGSTGLEIGGPVRSVTTSGGLGAGECVISGLSHVGVVDERTYCRELHC